MVSIVAEVDNSGSQNGPYTTVDIGFGSSGIRGMVSLGNELVGAPYFIAYGENGKAALVSFLNITVDGTVWIPLDQLHNIPVAPNIGGVTPLDLGFGTTTITSAVSAQGYLFFAGGNKLVRLDLDKFFGSGAPGSDPTALYSYTSSLLTGMNIKKLFDITEVTAFPRILILGDNGSGTGRILSLNIEGTSETTPPDGANSYGNVSDVYSLAGTSFTTSCLHYLFNMYNQTDPDYVIVVVAGTNGKILHGSYDGGGIGETDADTFTFTPHDISATHGLGTRNFTLLLSPVYEYEVDTESTLIAFAEGFSAAIAKYTQITTNTAWTQVVAATSGNPYFAWNDSVSGYFQRWDHLSFGVFGTAGKKLQAISYSYNPSTEFILPNKIKDARPPYKVYIRTS